MFCSAGCMEILGSEDMWSDAHMSKVCMIGLPRAASRGISDRTNVDATVALARQAVLQLQLEVGHTFWLFSRLLEGAPASERALPVLQEYAAAHLNWARELLQRTAEVSDAAALPYSQAARVALLLLETVDECFAEDPVG